MRDDFYQAILSLTDAVLRHTDEAGDAAGAGAAAGDDGGSAMRGRRRVDSWLDANRSALEKVLEMVAELRELKTVDQAPVSVVLRQLRAVVRSADWASESA